MTSPDHPAGLDDREALLARIDRLEQEGRRAFEEAQREADVLFGQYQLSQIVASGGSLSELGSAITIELVRLARAGGGALWVAEPATAGLTLVAAVGDERPEAVAAGEPEPPPGRLAGLDAGRRWAAARPGGRAVVLGESEPAALLVVWPEADGRLDEDGLRVAQLARHELSVAFQGARLSEVLERERHELSAIVDGATDVIAQVDERRVVVRLNPAGRRLFGLTGEPSGKRTCDDLFGCDVAGGHGPTGCPLAEVLASGRPIAYRESVVRGADGRSIRIAGSYSSAPAGGGGGRRATAILRDVSAIRALEELREAFVATVSHELRTPLALIRGYAETLLEMDLDDEQRRSFVVHIDEASSRLTTLVDQILDITHLQADPLILERSPASLAALVARLRGDLAPAGNDDRLIAELPPDLPPLEVDGARVGQILENLVGNAIKYAPAGSTVTLSTEIDGEWLVVQVDDEGIGIPESERALVTEPFHRAWNVRESRIPGTGLGLYICRRLVEAHGGRLWLGDRPDGRAGTRVAFTLPLLPGRRRPSHSAPEGVGGRA